MHVSLAKKKKNTAKKTYMQILILNVKCDKYYWMSFSIWFTRIFRFHVMIIKFVRDIY